MNFNRQHKDRIFCMIFGYEKYKGNLLDLYNALNETNYTNLEDLEITTMENAVYMSMKNDVSCIIATTWLCLNSRAHGTLTCHYVDLCISVICSTNMYQNITLGFMMISS